MGTLAVLFMVWRMEIKDRTRKFMPLYGLSFSELIAAFDSISAAVILGMCLGCIIIGQDLQHIVHSWA